MAKRPSHVRGPLPQVKRRRAQKQAKPEKATPSAPLNRNDRQHGQAVVAGDSRGDYQRDRDRILYSDCFKRLGGVTQVVSSSEGHLFHNRLTHSLKVAQVSRRLAERLLDEDSSLSDELSPDVCETAALAHDLGHPPFGHVAEKCLNQLAVTSGLSDGFEGNAQTFRILTRLAIHKDSYSGLNLSRACLNATLKYPWARDRTGPHSKKFGYYDEDKPAFLFSREGNSAFQDEEKSLEAQIMDLADEITYSVHDLEDFYRAGMLPVDRLSDENDSLIGSLFERWRARDPNNKSLKYFDQSRERISEACAFLQTATSDDASPGSVAQLSILGSFRSGAITRFLSDVTVDKSGPYFKLKMPDETKHLMNFLKQLIWNFVILNPKLATQQAGQIALVSRLFNVYKKALSDGERNIELLPARFEQSAREVVKVGDSKPRALKAARLAIDVVASLSEQEAIILDRRTTGVDVGSVVDLIA